MPGPLADRGMLLVRGTASAEPRQARATSKLVHILGTKRVYAQNGYPNKHKQQDSIPRTRDQVYPLRDKSLYILITVPEVSTVAARAVSRW